jgi:predicted permease
MTLAMILLLGAGVLVRSFSNVVNAETGVLEPERIVVGLLSLPSDKYPTPGSRAAFFDRLTMRLRAIAGSEDVSIASTVPTRSSRGARIEVEGRPALSDDGQFEQLVRVGPNYFRTLGRPTISGRDFTMFDVAGAPGVVIVNESFAATFWPGENAVGRRLRLFDGPVPGPWRTVVGVAANVMQGDPTRQRFRPVIYAPFHQQPSARAFVFVRTSVSPDQMAQAVLAELRTFDPDVAAEDLNSLKAEMGFDRDWMDLEHADLGKHAAIAPTFGIVALVLAGLGLVAVVAHSVSQRTKEIGVRMAIGAGNHEIGQMILREGMQPVLIGLLVGLVASLGANRLLQSQLVGVSPYDPLTMTAGPLLLIAVAVIGCRIPARRAMRVDPVVALRQE